MLDTIARGRCGVLADGMSHEVASKSFEMIRPCLVTGLGTALASTRRAEIGEIR